MKTFQFIFLILFFSSHLLAEGETIWLGGVNIYLGISKMKLLEEIDKKNYTILDDGQTVSLRDKSVNDMWLGTIFFENNKAISVQKNWTTNLGNTEIEHLNILFTLLSKQNKEGKNNYIIKTNNYFDVNVKFNVIYFKNKLRTFKLIIFEESTQIVEILGKVDYSY